MHFEQVKTIEEHQSGINQMLRVNKDLIITASDDCTLKFWNAHTLKVEQTLQTETITCAVVTGPKMDILVTGCHSGNFMTLKVGLGKKEIVQEAHINLIRCLISLNSLGNKYFVSADVCGIIKVWSSTLVPT